jgi:outer membrane protein OmpA-like peptidoglycan-associated protein
MSRLAAVLALPLALFAFSARAQFGDLLDSAKRKAEEAAKQKAEEVTRKAPPEKQEEAKPPARREGGKEAPAPPASDKAAGETAAPPPGEVYGNRYDFVPGDKVLVYDDFSDTDVGEYPAKWTLKGIEGHNPGGGNAVEVVERGGRRFLKSRYQKGESQDHSLHFLRYAIKGDLPKNFTIELDADIAGAISVVFSNPRGWGGQAVELNYNMDGTATSAQTSGKMPVKSGVHHVAIAVSGTQVKLYVGGERVLADPDGVQRPITRLGIEFMSPYAERADNQMFTAYRLAEGGKPAKQMLAGEGRIVTHGILFDTGSDAIKPESGPTLRAILQLLQEDAKLRFSIEGHTDDQGGPKVNQPLSERRAAAVKAWLVKEGIDAGRLASKGFGQTKPIDQNASAEGRANNRRVEFVRI